MPLNNPFAIAKDAKLGALHLVRHVLTNEEKTIFLMRKLKRGGFANIFAVAAGGVLTATGNFGNGDQVTIGARVYTMQTVLTGTPGNVLIAGDTAGSIANLAAAINKGGGAGTKYANGTTEHPDVAAVVDSNMLAIFANVPGAAGNAIATTETGAGAAWGAATLEDGADGSGLSTGWTLEYVRPRDQFGAVDVTREMVKRFEVSPKYLTPEQAALVSVVERGAFRYAVEYDDEPHDLQQSFVFRVTGRTNKES